MKILKITSGLIAAVCAFGAHAADPASASASFKVKTTIGQQLTLAPVQGTFDDIQFEPGYELGKGFKAVTKQFTISSNIHPLTFSVVQDGAVELVGNKNSSFKYKAHLEIAKTESNDASGATFQSIEKSAFEMDKARLGFSDGDIKSKPITLKLVPKNDEVTAKSAPADTYTGEAKIKVTASSATTF